MPITKLETVLRGQLSGFALDNDSSDLNNAINFAVGSAADINGAGNISSSSVFIKRLNATWASGSGNGGLDTGSKAAGTSYHVFVIKNPTNGSVDGLFSLSATSPTLPSGYTLFRRVGSLYTDGSANFVQFNQQGDHFYPSTIQFGYAQTNVGVVTNATISLAFVPTGVQLKVLGELFCGGVNNQSTGYAWVNVPGVGTPATDTVTIGGNNENTAMMAKGGHTGGEASGLWHVSPNSFMLLTNTSAQLTLTTQASLGGNVHVRIRIFGWIDNRDQ